ncbi:MAG: lytic transglycosylase domain-containing protein [Elusimicrobia bacterium]|nr:lytic transglycosylase domain-containing protein [Elusimicrobiota bacterium]
MRLPNAAFWVFAACLPAAGAAARSEPPREPVLASAAQAHVGIPRTPPPSPARPPAAARAALVVPAPRPDKSYQRLFRRLSKQRGKIDRYDAFLVAEARRRGLDPRLLKSIIGAESEFNPRARSPKGALGLMQLMPPTAESMGIQKNLILDPIQNIRAGAAYIEWLYSLVGKRHRLSVRMNEAPLWAVQRVLAAYHAGPRMLTRGSYPETTRQYVRKVLLFQGSKVSDLRR